jgi:hypothetical protein
VSAKESLLANEFFGDDGIAVIQISVARGAPRGSARTEGLTIGLLAAHLVPGPAPNAITFGGSRCLMGAASAV